MGVYLSPNARTVRYVVGLCAIMASNAWGGGRGHTVVGHTTRIYRDTYVLQLYLRATETSVTERYAHIKGIWKSPNGERHEIPVTCQSVGSPKLELAQLGESEWLLGGNGIKGVTYIIMCTTVKTEHTESDVGDAHARWGWNVDLTAQNMEIAGGAQSTIQGTSVKTFEGNPTGEDADAGEGTEVRRNGIDVVYAENMEIKSGADDAGVQMLVIAPTGEGAKWEATWRWVSHDKDIWTYVINSRTSTQVPQNTWFRGDRQDFADLWLHGGMHKYGAGSGIAVIDVRIE